MTGSRIFRQNRAVGYVSNHVPTIVRYLRRRRDYLITACIGRSFQVYNANNLRLWLVGATHSADITCMAADKFYTYTTSDKVIYLWRFGKHLEHVLKGHNKNVHLLLPFGNHLIAIDEENILKVWNTREESVYLEIPFNENDFKITAIMHPPTYINKILLGSEQGLMQLWNIKESKLVYTFKVRATNKISVIAEAPAIDVAAVGHFSGNIFLINLKYDEVIVEFNQDWGPVTSITFRTDGHPVMATASSNGNIAFWNLEEKRAISQITAHHDAVTTAICLANEPLMLTTSPDNSMKLWTFDLPDGGARVLRSREGHSAPPIFIRYHGSKGENILSSAEDRSLRSFSTITEILNKNFGRAKYRKTSKKKKRFEEDYLLMPPITQFTSEITRDKEWDSIAAIHEGIGTVSTWSFHKSRMGDLKINPKTGGKKAVMASTLVITHCGNFVIIGYTTGSVERFNMQSGYYRATYGKPAHDCTVRGVACDNLNQIVTTGGSDGVIKFWHFKENVSHPIAKLNMNNGIALIQSHRESSMLCIALDNFMVCILDYDTKTIVRKFEGHKGKINDVTFSPDSRWLITASMDCTIKIWDIPSSYLIDHFQVERPCISLTMSPTGNFLATAHVNCLGIYLWANKALFNQLSLRSIDPYEDAPYTDLPTSMQDKATLEDAISELEINDGEDIEGNYTSPEQLSDELITFSNLAASRWQNLLDLDLIKKRNKPKAPLKTPKQAPFFLPTVHGTDFKFDLSNVIKENDKSKLIAPSNFNSLTIFGKLLKENTDNENFEKCFDYLKGLGPSMIDFEIKSLEPAGGGSYKIMLRFLKMIVYMFESKTNFELTQAYLGSFLKSHGRSITESAELLEYLPMVEKAQQKSWKIIEEKLFYGLGVVNALRNYVN